MGFSVEFFRAMEAARRPVMDTSVRVFASMPSREFVPRWYVMLYQIIRATEPTLLAAIDSCEGEPSLWNFFTRKLREESGHDEILLADLRSVGVSGLTAETAPVIPWIAEMVGRQLYLIEHAHPAIYLGFIGLLEGFPPTLEQIDAIQAASGFPAEAFACARLHAAADVGHRADLAKILDATPQDLHAGIIANGARCAALQCAALEYIATTEII